MYPLNFRKKIFHEKESLGLTFEETSKRFCIGLRTLHTWQRNSKIGVNPKLKRERKTSKIDMEALSKDVDENPDSYQKERARKFGVSKSGIFSALKLLKKSCKKKLFLAQK
jgi:transposase